VGDDVPPPQRKLRIGLFRHIRGRRHIREHEVNDHKGKGMTMHPREDLEDEGGAYY